VNRFYGRACNVFETIFLNSTYDSQSLYHYLAKSEKKISRYTSISHECNIIYLQYILYNILHTVITLYSGILYDIIDIITATLPCGVNFNDKIQNKNRINNIIIL